MELIECHNFALRGFRRWAPLALLVSACAAQPSQQAQLSTTAYRALGQPDLRQNGVNRVEAGTLSGPKGLALDSQGHLYVADTFNHRVQAWTSAVAFHNGDPAALILGQPSPEHSNQSGIGPKGFAFPIGLAVDPVSGHLYVADTGHSRVLRFLKPFANTTRVEPDAVYGQPDFNSGNANTGGVSAHSMNQPSGLAFDGAGDLWVSDTANHRVLRFAAASLNTTNPSADLVLGQADFSSTSPNRGAAVSASGFNNPWGLAFDAQNDLYVADFQNTRVLKFLAPVTTASAVTVVYGEADFKTTGVPQTPTSSSLAGPTGIAVSGAGDLYVSVAFDNRILVFAASAKSGDPAQKALGQPDLTTTTINTSAFPQASASSLYGVSDVKVDAQGNVFVADSGNNRVLSFAPGSTSAAHVLGQKDLTGDGPNQIKPGSINAPYKIAVDYSHSPFALYVSDTNNHRVLVWKDSAHFRTGDAADLVIGQPNLSTAFPNVDSGGTNTPSATSLSAPRGIAVAADGTVYVADAGNHRVLRYPRPVAQSGRIHPDTVLGQADFVSAASAAVSAVSMNTPAGVAIGPNGNIFVADSGNNRVIEFAKGAGTGASAVSVFGQPGFTSSALPSPVSAQTLSAPQGIFVDAGSNLYVADSGSNRVVVFPNTKNAPPVGLAASIVIGQSAFNAGGAQTGPAGLNVPLDVGLDSSSNIFVSDTGNNRVMVFPSLLFMPTAGGAAYLAIGQSNLSSASANFDSTDGLSTAAGLAAPAGILVDRRDTLYIGDTGNNRVVHYLKPVALLNGAHFEVSVPVGRGAWTALFGSQLSSSTQLSHSASLPTALASRSLVVNDTITAALYYVSPTQINFIFPSTAPLGTDRIATRVSDTGELLAGGTVSVAEYSPGFFTKDSSGTGQAAALNQDNTLNSATNPAARGTVVQLFGTGQGPVASPVSDGQQAPPRPDKTVAVPTSDATTCVTKQPAVCVALGGSPGAVFGEVQYSGLAPGLIGVWQVNVKIPTEGLLGNTITVSALIGGANQSNRVTIAVK